MSWAKLWLSSYQTPWRSVTNLLWRSPFRKWTSCCCSSWGRQFNVRKKRNSSKVSPIYPLVSLTEKIGIFENDLTKFFYDFTETQHAFVPKIKEVTDNPERIWNKDLDDPMGLEDSQRNHLYQLLVKHLRLLVQERDQFSHQIVEITLASPSATQETNGITPERNHLALEVSEFKAKVRKLNQQL